LTKIGVKNKIALFFAFLNSILNYFTNRILNQTMKPLLLSIFCIVFNCSINAQSPSNDSSSAMERIFLPALEIGYVHNNSTDLLNGIMIKTSIEYRLSNVKGIFFRLNYDTYDVRYQLSSLNGLTNIVEGTAFFSDLITGAGFRLGTEKWRFFLLTQGGVKFYDYPNARPIENGLAIEMGNKSAPILRLTVGSEYYINSKTAVTFDFFYGNVFSNEHFWNSGNGIIGASIGFTTALN